MRVLAVGNLYPPHHLGGYELVWQSAVRHLRALGHEVRVLTTETTMPTAAGPEDPDVHRELRWWWRDHELPRFPLRKRLALERHNGDVLERHMQSLQPEVVTWWSMGGMSLSLVERVRRSGVPAVAFVHDDWLDYGPRADQWLRLFAGRPAAAGVGERLFRVPCSVDLDRAARYAFVSEATRRRALAAGRHPADSTIAHSGIDPSFIDPRPERDWSWRILYVGRIDSRKGIETAVAALGKLPAETTLTIVGDGAPGAERALRAQAGALGLTERIDHAGFRPRAELPSLYAGADAVVFPVLWEEPWGLVPLEAMALGRPVVATGRGGSGEYLRDGENALLFAPGDPDALAGALRRLAEDPALRARLRAGGLETAPRHTEDVFNAVVAEEVERACG